MASVLLLHNMVEITCLSGEKASRAAILVETIRTPRFGAWIDQAGNAVGVPGDGRREIVRRGHIDAVSGALPLRIEDGKLYGRFGADANGPLATFIAAAAAIPPETKGP